MQEGDNIPSSNKEEKIFAKKQLGKLVIDLNKTKIAELKELIFQKFDLTQEAIGSAQEIRVRNPKCDDLGDVLQDDIDMSTLFFYDGKELLV